MNPTRLSPSLLIAMLAAASLPARAQIKIVYIDPLSGLMAATGEHGLRELRFAADRINDRGGILGQKLEIVAMDNKLSPQESLALLNRAVDEGIHYVFQGNGSSVAGALIDGINKNNERNPDKRVVFLNYAAVDPDFTNSKCSFWHFRFDANSDMKLQAITDTMVGKKDIKKVYIIGQDYSFGHQVSKTAKELIKQKRPDDEIEAFKKKYGPTEDPYTTSMAHAMELLTMAMNETKSADPAKVAKAMEGKKFQGHFGEIEMRKDDHQMIQPLYVATFAKVDGKKVKFPADGTKEFGFKTDVKIDAAKTALPTTCQMQRPQVSANP